METLKDIRENLGYSQAAMAEALGLSQSTISRYEQGVLDPDKRTMIAASTLLKKRRGK